jgi:hypothetical protein
MGIVSGISNLGVFAVRLDSKSFSVLKIGRRQSLLMRPDRAFTTGASCTRVSSWPLKVESRVHCRSEREQPAPVANDRFGEFGR